MSFNDSDTSTISVADSLVSRNHFNAHSKKFMCDICDRTFAKRYNLVRHTETFHDDEHDDNEETICDMEEDDDTDKSMSDETTTETESSTDEESNVKGNYVTNMFRNILEKAYCEHDDELDKIRDKYLKGKKSVKEAMILALLESDKAKKTIRHLYAQNIIDINEQRQHPLFKAIMAKIQQLRSDGFDKNEAIKCAVGYRKHGIYDLIKHL